MSARQLLQECKVEEALLALQEEIRREPADVKLRIFLFQLLAVTGNWDRALTQLEVAKDMDAATLAMVHMYRDALQCEALRADIFSGRRSPLIFGEPEEWLALLAEALRLTADGDLASADALRAKAFAEAPAGGGELTLNDESAQSRSFDWIADADSRLGPVLEAVINGRYYWVPFHRIGQVDLEPPSDLRDLVWTPAHFLWTNGGSTVGLIPTRYAGSESHGDGQLALARKTDWMQLSENCYCGLGQRVLATDDGEFSLLELRQIRLAAADATEAREPDHG